MDNLRRTELAKDQLDRVLNFFPRIDNKSSVVLAIDTGMLAFLTAHAPAFTELRGWIAFFPALTVFLITMSITYLYKGGSPSLEGGRQSLIYFREIAQRAETNYVDDIMASSEEKYLKDILGQIWRNSSILKEKFDHLKTALTFLAWAIIPWATSLALFTISAK